MLIQLYSISCSSPETTQDSTDSWKSMSGSATPALGSDMMSAGWVSWTLIETSLHILRNKENKKVMILISVVRLGFFFSPLSYKCIFFTLESEIHGQEFLREAPGTSSVHQQIFFSASASDYMNQWVWWPLLYWPPEWRKPLNYLLFHQPIKNSGVLMLRVSALFFSVSIENGIGFAIRLVLQ